MKQGSHDRAQDFTRPPVPGVTAQAGEKKLARETAASCRRRGRPVGMERPH